jgi:hypothetical protein
MRILHDLRSEQAAVLDRLARRVSHAAAAFLAPSMSGFTTILPSLDAWRLETRAEPCYPIDR